VAARGSDYVAHDKEQLAVTAHGLEVSTLDPHPDRRWADLYQVGRLVRGDTPVEVSFGAWIDVVGRRAGSALHVVKDSADVSEPVEARSAGLPDRLQVPTGFPLPDLCMALEYRRRSHTQLRISRCVTPSSAASRSMLMGTSQV
jgi:hypothetical protein